jgi:hypothetical protein
MDPVTLALIGAAVLAGVGIKRAAAPPPRPPRPEGEAAPEGAPSLYGIPPHAFGGALRPAVTHKAVTKDRPTEDERGGAPAGEEPAKVSPVGFAARAQTAAESGGVPDVAGGGERLRAAPTPEYTFTYGPKGKLSSIISAGSGKTVWHQ